jgi:primosomal protein N' (replication factor Y)
VTAGASFAEVAVPVPVRHAFTYSVPAALTAQLAPGSRVAVPFGPRKLPAFVVALTDTPPAQGRTRPIAGLLEREPVLTPELLAFLHAASEYYMHPIGEVLRAAAPAVPTEAMKTLRAQGFLDAGESLPGPRIATRSVLVVRSLPAPEGAPDVGKLGKNQSLLLELVRERGEVTLDELRRHLKNPRDAVRKLAARNLVATTEREVAADRFFADEIPPVPAPTPNPEQRTAIDALIAQLGPFPGAPDRASGGGFLLHGITGSGKTEVYLRLIAEARARGKGSLMLVPEIALTPQLVSRFRSRFGDSIAVLHSELSDRERNDAWKSLRAGRVDVAIGARSALFAPVQNLGVIVVDEEHDGSFKQEEGFRYQARDMALLRAHRAGAVCVLGSATPSLESYRLCQRGKLTKLELKQRATSQALPPVEIVDLARHKSGPGGQRLITGPLYKAIEQCLGQGEQSILFLNRRGFAPSVRCNACSKVLECGACSVALTLHKGASVLRCHYCDFMTPHTGVCIACGSPHVVELGLGTEQLEQVLIKLFPAARVGRLDRDTASGIGVEAVLERLRNREIDILVGTQMVTKGHDVPHVTLVGVILADQSLAFPDFRASERTFQLLTQVSGRAGRGERPGRVILQTFQPANPAIAAAQRHDYKAFSENELEAREELGWPPYARLVAVRIDAADEGSADRVASELAAAARTHPAVRSDQVKVLGPAPAPIARVRARYRYRFMLKGNELRSLRAVAAVVRDRIDAGVAPARASLDIDPVSML